MVKPLDGPGIFQSMLTVVLFLRDTERVLCTLYGLVRLDQDTMDIILLKPRLLESFHLLTCKWMLAMQYVLR
jgi:hypothetical protein